MLFNVIETYGRKPLPQPEAGAWIHLLKLLKPNEIYLEAAQWFLGRKCAHILCQTAHGVLRRHPPSYLIYSASVLNPPLKPMLDWRMAFLLFWFIIDFFFLSYIQSEPVNGC